ncbi:MAG TPA: elongation factor P maturation arginine rhamnosyltransferase EarP [Casimicrobiaceae bacterium]|nr:elongation factor P maturation arginine rhamnosyltransferase EarP [Casimicrobiaceae bacterium]
MTPSLRWDIFCRVVDNYGDAGVCWRLARQLAAEHGLIVTLWIDDIASLSHIEPALDPARDDQVARSVRVRRSTPERPAPFLDPDVVIEGFGCGLPDDYRDAMAREARPPVWVNLEYLSAEAWVESAHALPSPHPRLPLTCWFYFPGFTPRTGGLLREEGLQARCRAFRRDAKQRLELFGSLGMAPSATALTVSLFCYANPALPALLDTWADGDEDIVCIVPVGVAQSDLDRWSGGALPHPGRPAVRGRLTVAVANFVDQDSFDHRLWACDLNFVRGEDSLVRAIWAGQPLVWHIYPQAEDVHLLKLDALLARFEGHANDNGLGAAASGAQRVFWRAWNVGDSLATADAWPTFRAALPELKSRGRAWGEALARQTDLAEGLVRFCENRL